MEALYEKYNYPSYGKFIIIAKEHGINATQKEIKLFIDKQTVQQLHKQTPHSRNKQRRIIASAPYEMFQIDLLDYKNYSQQNKGFKYILIAVDIFTRQAFAAPLKNKSAAETLEGFKVIIATHKPHAVYHDDDKAFLGVFNKYCDDNDIVSITNYLEDHHALGVIDRFSRTLKSMIAKFMTAKDTTKYIDELDRLINIYNNTSHSSLVGLKPIEVEKNEENIITVGNINQEKREHNQVLDKKIKIKKGDLVRIKLKRTIFTKGYEVRYSNEVYTVEEVKGDAVLLNDERTIQIKNVMIVPNDAENIPKGKKRKIDKVIKHIQRLAREGLI